MKMHCWPTLDLPPSSDLLTGMLALGRFTVTELPGLLFICVYHIFFNCRTVLYPLFHYSDKHLFLFIFYLFPVVYFSNSVRLSVTDINCGTLTDFVALFETASFKSRVNDFEPPFKRFLKCVRRRAGQAAKKVMGRFHFYGCLEKPTL